MTPTTYHLRYIMQNYNIKSDSELAADLEVSKNFVTGLRRRNGLRKCQDTWRRIGSERGGRARQC